MTSYKQWEALMLAAVTEEHSEEHPEGVCDEAGCQECCTHDDRDHGICLDCGDDNNGQHDYSDYFGQDR